VHIIFAYAIVIFVEVQVQIMTFKSIKDLLALAYNAVTQGIDRNVSDDKTFDILSRIHFVRLPSHLLPQSNAKISLKGVKGDRARLLRFWPCIVYEGVDELLDHVSGDDADRVKAIHRSRAEIKVVARLIGWKERASEAPRQLLRLDKSSEGGYDLGVVTLVHLAADSIDQNMKEDNGELLNFLDTHLELENVMDCVITDVMERTRSPSCDHQSSKDLYEHALRFRTAVDTTLNLTAAYFGRKPPPLRSNSSKRLLNQPVITPSPKKQCNKSTLCNNEIGSSAVGTSASGTDNSVERSDESSITPEFNHSPNRNDSANTREPEARESPCNKSTSAVGTSASGTDNSVERSDESSITPEFNHSPNQNYSANSKDRIRQFAEDYVTTCLRASSAGKSRNKTQSSKNAVGAEQNEAGSRLVWNRDTSGSINAKNDRTCLPDAIQELLHPCKKAAIYDSMISNMAPIGDTTVASMNSVLTRYGLTLQHATQAYIDMGGSLAYTLLQERACKIVVRIKLTNSKGKRMWHCVAWNGQVIYDRPKKCIVNQTKDRQNPKGCDEVFHKLFPRKHFSKWEITNIYRLVSCPIPQKNVAISSTLLAEVSIRLATSTDPDLNKLIQSEGLVLRNISKVYRQRPGPAIRLINEQDCRIIIKLRFIDGNNQNYYHFVGWDGKVIYDGQRMVPVNKDVCTSKRGCIQVFHDLAAKNFSPSWRIDCVYILEQKWLVSC